MFLSRGGTKPFLLFFVFLVLLGVVGFRYFYPSQMSVQIYYPEKNNLFLVPVTRSVKTVTPFVLLQELKKPPVRSELTGALPPMAEAPRVEISGNTVTINFMEPISLEKWPFALKSILSTFKQLPGIEKVNFLIQGKSNVISDGQELGTESLSGFWVNDHFRAVDRTLAMQERRKVIVYYLLKGTSILVPITQQLSTKLPPEETIVEAWDNVPPFPGVLTSPLPEGSHILYVASPSLETLELKVELTGRREAKKLFIKAVLLSFTELPSVRFVRIHEKGKFWSGWFRAQRPGIINLEGRVR